MSAPSNYSLFDDADLEVELQVQTHTAHLPAFDGGYFDALVAIGFAALVDAYFDCAESPLITWSADGFRITYAGNPREEPDLTWLKYSVAGTWRKGSEADWRAPRGQTLKTAGWDEATSIPTHGLEVDVSTDPTLEIPVGERTITITEPLRQLYGVANKIGSPEWLNLCIHACRTRGRHLINGDFEEGSVTLNSLVLPEASKGAFSASSFAIENKNLPNSITKRMSRFTCLAVAGLIVSARGQSPQKSIQGFAVPVPQRLRLEDVKHIAAQNRRRLANGGFFFAYDNYLSFMKLLLIYIDEQGYSREQRILYSVAGANYIPLGNSSSPSGSWQLVVPKHRYSLLSVERLQWLLVRWKLEKRPDPGKPAAVDRAAVAQLMRGFENSNPAEAAEGYLSYIFDVGLHGKRSAFYPLTHLFFEEIMEHSYGQLLAELKGEAIKPFIDLIRRETYNAVFPLRGQSPGQPNYQMMRRLREVQSKDDFVHAITEIAIDRGMTKLATARSDSESTRYWANPYEPSLVRLIALAEESAYPPRLLAQLLLALALCRRPYEPAEGEDATEAEVPEADDDTDNA
jgi:hypothetical protein